MVSWISKVGVGVWGGYVGVSLFFQANEHTVQQIHAKNLRTYKLQESC